MKDHNFDVETKACTRCGLKLEWFIHDNSGHQNHWCWPSPKGTKRIPAHHFLPDEPVETIPSVPASDGKEVAVPKPNPRRF